MSTSALNVQAAVPADVARTITAAQDVLRRRFGAKVQLAQPEDLGGSERSTVLRVRVIESPFSLPRTLVIKHYRQPLVPAQSGEPFAREAASSQLFTALAPAERVSPELIAHDANDRILVLEDLGRAPTLADKLLGSDARVAERALLGWARTLGRLHATTAGREADFDALLRRLKQRSWRDPVAAEARVALSELPGLLKDALGVSTSIEIANQAHHTAHLLGGTPYRAFSPSDVCPDNNLVTSKGVRFLDFEWGCVRDIALDLAYLRIPFPACWCSFAFPAGMSEAMLAAWRSEVTEIWPEFAQDDVLLPRLLDAQILWVWLSTWWLLPRTNEPDRPIDAKLQSPWRSAALVHRWRRLHVDAITTGHIELAEYAATVVAALIRRFGSAAAELPLYPAFQ